MFRISRQVVLCAFAMSLVLAGRVRADDTMIDNPIYSTWAKFKPGTLIKYATDVNAMGNKTSTESTQTLKDVTPDKVTVEAKTSMVISGNKMDMPATTLEIPAKIKKPDTASGPGADAPKTDISTEDVQAAGKTYSCKKNVTTSEANGMTTKATTWTCDNVPGSVVKMEAETSGAMTATTNMVLTDFEPQ